MLDSSTVVTRKLYYEDAYLREFESEIISADANDIVLDATAFFPEEGGQSPDKGVLAGYEVLDVQIVDGYIHHFLGQKVPGIPVEEIFEGARVNGSIDWNHRFSNMQQHSGEHIFSGLVHTKFGYDNVGFHLSDSEVTMDFTGVISPEGLREIEEEANHAITRNIPSQIRFLEGEDAVRAEYRSKLELTEAVRVVTFPGYDACACCAPHVEKTGEIGCLKVVGAINYKGGMRVSILCGARAMQLFYRDHDILTRTANFLTTSADEVYGSVTRLKNENTELKARLKQTGILVMKMKTDAVPEGDGDVLMFETVDTDQSAIREAVNALMEKRTGFCALFAGSDAEGYRFIIGRKNGDARQAATLLREKFGARGGGKPVMVQGSVKATEAAIREAFECMAEH